MNDNSSAIALRNAVDSVYRRLRHAAGHQGWWPGDTPFEVTVGAVLTQNTSWKNVEKAVANLKHAGMLDASAILSADDAIVAELIRPSGYYNIKTRRLKALCRFLIERDAADPAALERSGCDKLRHDLLAVNGIGRETADSILLYAMRHPVFVVDAYTRRIFGRLQLIDPLADYDVIREFFQSCLGTDLDLLGDYHAQIVLCAKEFCRTKPLCLKCPLAEMCPTGRGNAVA